MNAADRARCRYCVDCRRWVFSFVYRQHATLGRLAGVRMRPGTTKIRHRGAREARALGRPKAYGYLCDACAGVT